MSLVVGWLMENFVAMASDGKAVVKDESGKVSLVGEDVPKFHLFTPDLIIAAAADNEFFDVLVQSLEPLVEQSRSDEHLFEYLTVAIPLARRNVSGVCGGRGARISSSMKSYPAASW